jgi:hypothetical protein
MLAAGTNDPSGSLQPLPGMQPLHWRSIKVESREQCLVLAAEARATAETALLDNVRQKHFAAALAWELLATQVSRIIANRRGGSNAKDLFPEF